MRARVKPGARATRVTGVYNGGLKLEVAAPPEGGKANEACRRLIAETVGARAADVELQSGPASRNKAFVISGMGVEEVRGKLEKVVGGAEKQQKMKFS